MSITKRQKTNLKKLAQAALKTADEPELNKLAIAIVKLGLLDHNTATAAESDGESPGLQRLQRIQAIKKDLRAEGARIARQNFEARARTIFENDPDLESFAWRQGTPTETQEYRLTGFMRVHAETPFVNGEEQPWRNPRDEDGTAGSIRRTLAYMFWPTELEDMFGDGSEITVKRDGTIERTYWWPPDD